MDLQEKSKEISECLSNLKKSLITRKEEVQVKIENTLEDLRKASEMGDRSENAAFTQAVEDLGKLNGEVAAIEKQIAEIELVDDESRYNSIGIVVYYTTVRLRTKGQEFVVKLYPNEISDIENGILAYKDTIGKYLWHKKKGDKFTVPHRVTGDLLEYEIVDLY